jgi:predicted NodU family carbamoyl transferase
MLVLGLSGNLLSEDPDLAPYMPNGFLHDSAACLISDGVALAAVEEERFDRIKQTERSPINAIRACLDIAGLSPSQIDAVGYYFQESSVNRVLNGLYKRHSQLPIHSARELMVDHLNGHFGLDLPYDHLLYAEHHVAHAASCFTRSGMDEALVIVMDAQGDRHSTTVFRGTCGRLESLATYDIGKSLGYFYLSAISLLAYDFGDEYKVMGLAPYGNPEKYRDIFNTLYALTDRGDYALRLPAVETVFLDHGFTPRLKGQEFTQDHIDFAAGIQHTLETIAMHILTYWAQNTGLVNLCFVGGVAHNSSLNGLILRSGTFREVFVHPASHDAGAAEGAALAAAHQLGALPYRQPRLRSASLGPSLGTAAEIEKELACWDELIEYERPADIVGSAAELLAEGAVLGWAHGRSEYGPRALGNRSILADARPSDNKQKINSMVKKRESYRPFAPVVTSEAAAAYFDLPETRANYDFMSFVVNVRQDRRAELGAVTHVDGSARLQVIDPASNQRFYRLVRRFGELTGIPVLLNTSFNNNAEPIVQSVHDALTCFLTTELDVLVIEDFLIRRRQGHSLALDSLVPSFRPVTRLARRIGMTSAGAQDVVYEIYLDYPKGPRAEISATSFALLKAADGVRCLDSLAHAAGGLTTEVRREIYGLWQERFFALRPAGTTL